MLDIRSGSCAAQPRAFVPLDCITAIATRARWWSSSFSLRCCSAQDKSPAAIDLDSPMAFPQFLRRTHPISWAMSVMTTKHRRISLYTQQTIAPCRSY